MHSETGSEVIGLEIKAQAYACNIPALQNMIFVNFEIAYSGNSDLKDVRIALFNNTDLGNAFDDYIGSDTGRRMVITYNGDNYDDGTNGYGSNLTQSACVITKSPLDSGSAKQSLGNMIYYYNSSSTTGNPTTPQHYHNYIHGKWKDGQPFTDACDARAAGNPTNYVYTDDPSLSGGWSEKACNRSPDDRRFVLSTSSFSWVPGSDPLVFNLAFINTPIGSNNDNFNLIKAMADTAMMYQDGCSWVAPLSTNNNILSEEFLIIPNPTNANVNIQWSSPNIKSVNLLSPLGQTLSNYNVQGMRSQTIPLAHLANGIYFIKINTENSSVTKKIMKQ